MEKTKITDNEETTSLNHSTKQGDNNSNIRVTELKRWETA